MVRIVTEYLDHTTATFPDKIAFADAKKHISFAQLQRDAQCIATEIIRNLIFKSPIAIYLDKGTDCVSAFLGAVYSGNFYSPLDTGMPVSRIEKIMTTLEPEVIITDQVHFETAKSFGGRSRILVLEDLLSVSPDTGLIAKVTDRMLDTDILYVLFTSGSTGMPKGVTISHKALIDFTEWGTERFDINETYVFGNQTPFYFSMSVFDIYQTLKNGATTYIIPHEKFSFPTLLMEYLKQHGINTLYWVPTALSFVAICGALNCPHVDSLKNIFFSGEVMPVKQLNRWIKEYPDARYVNLYGPTELTDVCAAYEVNRAFSDQETLPMGQACRNMDVFLLDTNDKPVPEGEIGEVCVRGTGLSYGYYGDPEKTSEVFVQNPLQPRYPETIYRTGDLARKNEFGELVYVSRKDFQIKHMGHRIELGEIEAAVSSLEGIDSCCCLYNGKRQWIILYYTGSIEESLLTERLKALVPGYMLPNKKYRIETMPLNLNGKIDRQKLKDMAGI